MSDDILLKVEDLKVYFDIKSDEHIFDFGVKKLKAVNGITFQLKKGETLGVVGESGCGKSTLARAIIGLVPSHSGKILFDGKDLTQITKNESMQVKKDIQMIFQDPLACLDPRMTIGDIISEPIISFFPDISKNDRKQMVKDIMKKVGLLPNVINRYPHEFSGGQCQRIGIARALVVKPKLIICDEPVSALDVSIQAQVTNLLKDLQKELGISLIFIAHDLSVVKHISDRVMVMYLGNFVEIANKKDIYDDPKHPYTEALISAVPIPDPKLEKNKKIQLLQGDLPSPINPPSGCVFRTRCVKVTDECSFNKPSITEFNNRHRVACINL